MADFVIQWIAETWHLVLRSAPWLFGGFLLAGVIYVLVPVDKVTHHLGRPGLGSVLKASLFGIPLPLCSCSVIPVASSIRKRGASRGAFVSFLISTPETGVDSIAISYALLGPFWAIIRPIAAFVTAISAGLLLGRSDGTGATDLDGADSDAAGENACGASCCHSEGTTTAKPNKIIAAVRYGLVDMISDLSLWLVSGFLLAGLAAALIPEGFLERYTGSGLPAMLLMLVVGLPVYVCSTSSTPVAAALLARGLSPGAALVFLLVGPATNIATMLVVMRDLGRRGLAIYLLAIVVVAVLFGLAIDWVLPTLPGSLSEVPGHGEHPASPAAWATATVMILLTLNGLRVRVSSGWRR